MQSDQQHIPACAVGLIQTTPLSSVLGGSFAVSSRPVSARVITGCSSLLQPGINWATYQPEGLLVHYVTAPIPALTARLIVDDKSTRLCMLLSLQVL